MKKTTLLLAVLFAAARIHGAEWAPSLKTDEWAGPEPARPSAAEKVHGKRTSAGSSTLTASLLESSIPPGSAALTALGAFGPLGAYGPLSAVGPVGNSVWKPSAWMKMSGKWSSAASLLSELGGPLSEKGPLGRGGPLGDAYTSFPEIYKAGGTMAVLGPAGPLGALGVLGPLGPVGAHGFKAGADGGYSDNGRPVSQVSVPYGDGSARRFSLVEVVPSAAAVGRVNDTSLLITGELGKTGDSAAFNFLSREEQYISVAAVPEKQLDSFQLEIESEGKVIAVSDSVALINWAHFKLPANTRFTVKVKLGGSWHYLSHTYRLAVTGSTAYAQ